MNRLSAVFIVITVAALIVSVLVCGSNADREVRYLSPQSLAVSPDGARLYAALSTAGQVAVIDGKSGKIIERFDVGENPSGLALSRDGSRLFVTCASPRGSLHVIDTASHGILSTFKAGHGAQGPVLSADEKTIFVCNRFANNISVIDLEDGAQSALIPAAREPIAAALDRSGGRLVVANHLPDGPADADYVAASVEIFNPRTRARLAKVLLPNGSTGVRGICISPDGRYAYVTHILARYHLPTTQLDRGWVNTNALSIVDIRQRRLVNSVLLDDVDRGAANPWGVVCSSDGRHVIVTHAGTDEISIIDAPALLAKLQGMPSEAKPHFVVEDSRHAPIEVVEKLISHYDGFTADGVRDDLSFLRDVRTRIALPGIGPRGIAVAGNRIFVSEYFSDSLSFVDISDGPARVKNIALGDKQPLTRARRGEMLFNDAKICYQSWQSCASCHPDARADGLNWDLLNDGMGNPKNTRSMLLSHRTPPVMITGIRKDAETAVRAGFRFIHFAVRPEEDAVAVDEYLKSLRPVPSPYLEDGELSEAARRGKLVYERAGCIACHSGPLHTDLRKHEVGTGTGREDGREFVTPTLAEVWRTAPYLYDGRAATIGDVFRSYNMEDRHGLTSDLTDGELSDLVEYVLSL